MPIGTATLTFDISDLTGVDFDTRRTKVWITTNIPGDSIIDTEGNKIRLGAGNVTLNADGTGSAVVWVPGAGTNPSSWQTYVHVDYPDRHAPGGRASRTFGPFTITAGADLADLVPAQEVPPTYLTAVTAELDTYVSSASAASQSAAASATSAAASADLAEDISNISTSDGVVEALVLNTGGVGPLTSAALAATYGLQSDTLINAKTRGVDASGSTDTSAALLALVQEALATNNLGLCSQGVYVPPGIYRLTTPLDFANLTIPPGTPEHLDGFAFICDPAAVFYVDFANASAISLGLPTGYQLRGATIQIGQIYDDAPQNVGVNGLRLRSISNSRITVNSIRGLSSSGILAEPSTSIGVFNNYIDVRMIRDCLYGFATLGYALPNVIGFQGNEVHIGQLSSCDIGLNVDANGVGRSSQWNMFHLGAVEDHTTAGISDACGQNMYFVGSAASATPPAQGDFVLTTGALSKPYVIGRMSNAVNLNGGNGTIINLDEPTTEAEKVANVATTTTGAAVDVNNLSHTFNSPGPHAEWEVDVTLDLTCTTGGAITFIGKLLDGASPLSGELLAGMANGTRLPVTRSWKVTALAAGSHTLKVTASTTGGGSYTANESHSHMVVRRVK